MIAFSGLKNFNIAEILECGQCFRFEKFGEGHYCLVAYGKVLYVKQDGDKVQFWYEGAEIDETQFNIVWAKYFDMQRDYVFVQQKIAEDDTIMQAAVDFAPGIRMLQQDPFEIIISFIISQNNRIPQIKQVVKNICEKYGEPIGGGHYSFPTPDSLATATSEDLRALKAGFRDKYIVDATKRVILGELPINRDCDVPTSELRQMLMDTKGIGEKVADCILLMGYGRYESFPIDVWVRRVMERLYFDGNSVPASKIQQFAKSRFGENAGFANQYLFHYIRITETKNGGK